MKVVIEESRYGVELPHSSDPTYERIRDLWPKIVGDGNLTTQDEKRQYIALASADNIGLDDSLPVGEKGKADFLIDMLYPPISNPGCRRMIAKMNNFRRVMRSSPPENLIQQLKEQAQRLANGDLGSMDEPMASLLFAAWVGEAEVLGMSQKNASQKNIEHMTLDEQIKVARGFLDAMERYPQLTSIDFSPQMSTPAMALESILANPKLEERVRKEIEVRRKLHDAFVLLKLANGVIKAKDGTMPLAKAVQDIRAKGRELVGTDYVTLAGAEFGPDGVFSGSVGMNGLRVDKAFGALERAGQNYMGLLRDALSYCQVGASELARLTDPASFRRELDNDPLLGTVGTNYFSDPDTNRKALVERYMKDVLIGGVDAKKSLELGERLMIVLGENSVMNRGGFFGSDDPAELMGLMAKRKAEAGKQGGKPGPSVHLNRVYSLVTSAVRTWAGEYDITKPLAAANLPYKALPGDLEAYFSRTLSEAHTVREDLMDMSPDIAARGKFETYQGLMRAFARAESCNKAVYDRLVAGAAVRRHQIETLAATPDQKRRALEELDEMCRPYRPLKFWTVAGDLSLGYLRSPLGPGWTVTDFNAIRKAVSDIRLASAKTGNPKTFLNEQEWKELDKEFGGKYVFAQGLNAARQVFFGGGKK